MFNTYFDDTQVALLLLGGLFIIMSMFMHLREKNNLSIGFIALSAICIFIFSALLDPFLNLWDERFHALVAKNLMKHPFMPTLYDDPVVDMAYDRWDRYHIWLHKQPLFLWQIALSFKIFGISEFTLRIPNIVLGTILVLITYRSGRLLVNHHVGYVASVLVISSLYILELIGGRNVLEHNDFTFLVYISLSIWSFIEYHYTNKKIWVYLIGLFSGMAILCKWLVGLLVYFGWVVLRILQNKWRISEYTDIFVAFLITFIVSAPWQFYTFILYPQEAINAYKFNLQHFTVPLDGHGGNFWYHFNTFNEIYGSFALLLVLPAFLAFFKKCKDKKIFYSLFSMVIVVYLFFSLAATKMPSFTIIVSMIVFIVFAALFDYIMDYLNQIVRHRVIFNSIFIVSILAMTLLRFDIEFLRENHTFWKEKNQYSRMLIHNKEVFSSLDLPTNAVLFNVKGRHYIEAMFYTGVPAYNFLPTEEQYNNLITKGRLIAIFNSGRSDLPEYLKNDSTIILIDQEIKGYP